MIFSILAVERDKFGRPTRYGVRTPWGWVAYFDTLIEAIRAYPEGRVIHV